VPKGTVTGQEAVLFRALTVMAKKVLGRPVELAAEPVPVRLAVCGLVEALSVTLRAPVRVPAAAGVKAIWMMQVAAAGRVAGQLLVWAKSPDVEMEVMERPAAPGLERIIGWAAVVVPMVVVAKVRLVDERFAEGEAGGVVAVEVDEPPQPAARRVNASSGLRARADTTLPSWRCLFELNTRGAGEFCEGCVREATATAAATAATEILTLRVRMTPR
jgi:hypothetical protein